MNPDPGPENLADVLAKLFTARGWGRKGERARLEQAWETAAGPQIAGQTRVLILKRQILEIEVRTAVLMQELAQFGKRPLLAAVREQLPGVTIKDLKFRPGAW
jgi:predicted nucleic acid-binding Zn ribbon protein